MKPVLLFSIRFDQAAMRTESESFLRFHRARAVLELRVVNLVHEHMPAIDLDESSAILLGGVRWNASDAAEEVSRRRRCVRSAEISALLDEWLLGISVLWGLLRIGTVGLHQGSVVDRIWPERWGRCP